MIGALVLGADYRGLGAVQSLGRRGITVWVLHDSIRGVANFSRYTHRSLYWPPGDDDSRVDFLIRLANEQGVDGWLLYPTRDDTVALCARHRDALGRVFRISTPPWNVVSHAYDKRLTHQLAAALGVPFPRTWMTANGGVESIACDFPAILKPAVKDEENALTVAKAWRVDDRASLAACYYDALKLLPADVILVQELIPGGGANQFSYAALADEGESIASIVARRTRQYPMDFGRASTFVETIDDDEVRALGRRVIAGLRYSGLVEVEFKRDPRTNELKLLDVNARLWGWHTLGRRAGVDFPFLLWRHANGDRPAPSEARPGVRWMWPAADVPVAAREILVRRLRLIDYLRSFRGPIDFATLSIDDPLPGLLELPLQIMTRLRRPAAIHTSPTTQGTLERVAT